MNRIWTKILLLTILTGFFSSGYIYADDYYGWRKFQNSKFNGEIKALEVYNGDLIAGGTFSSINGAPVYGLARWTGDHWESMGAVKNTEIYSLTVWNGSLVVGGKFNVIGAVTAKNIAKWNGTSWSALGSGLNNNVNALTVYNSKLIAGGKFTSSGSTQIKRVGTWGGSSWSETGDGLNADVNVLIVNDGMLTAGGSFTGKVAELHGSDWKNAGIGLTDEVNALTVLDGKLVAGGKFNKHIAQLSIGIWWTLGSGVEDDVNALQTINGKLVAGGKFRYAGSSQDQFFVNRIASWDGNSWGKFASGMSGSVSAIKTYNSNIVAAGNFWSAGGDTAYNIAIWKPVPYRMIQGRVFYSDNNEPVPYGVIYAAKLDIYTKKIVYLDTADVGSVGHQSGEYILDRVPEGEGDLLICFPSDEEDDNPSGSSEIIFVPTYYPASNSWITASRLPLFQSLSNINLYVERIISSDDPSSAIGSVNGTANLNYIPEGYPVSGSFDYKAGTIVFLKRNGSFYSYDVSGEDQKFYFDSIETGQYTLIADRMGYSTITMLFMVSQNTNVSFTLDTLSVITNVGNGTEVPSKYTLYQNYPNPFNPSSTIKFDIPENTSVKLRIYDMLGREVVTLYDGFMSAGSYEATWNASRYSSGVYFYRLETDGFIQTKRMVLVK
ncbi:MAG: T9SS type A sorting domain-containing protein [Ignavibacteriae bacterium]|nr:T9SS type A sorting domain-containing protein [Ignavibacteriota bacterium]